MRRSSPVACMAARSSAAATRASAVLARPPKTTPSAALVPSSTFALATLGAVPRRKAMSAAITMGETA
jgi:hypothetical protein